MAGEISASDANEAKNKRIGSLRAALERECDEIWALHGLRSPIRRDSGGNRVVVDRDPATGNRRIDRGGQ